MRGRRLITASYSILIFILSHKPVRILSKTTIREGSELILLGSTAFPLYDQGLANHYFLKWRNRYHRISNTNDISLLQVPSDAMKGRFLQCYGAKGGIQCSLYGCCNTDIYYKEENRKKAKKMLLREFPEAEGKKVILYMPTARMRETCGEWLSLLDVETMQELLGDEYTVIVHLNKQQLKQKTFQNHIEIPGFSKLIYDMEKLRYLMLAAEVLVGDYRDTFYEGALLEKPIYFTTSDHERHRRNPNFGCVENFDELIFGPVIGSAEELAKELKNPYDYSKMHEFRSRYLTDCDGHSVERVIKYLKRSV